MAVSFELQKTIYAILAALGTVYDSVPDNAEPLYMTIGEFTEEPWDTDDSIGRETFVIIHSWSRYEGHKELKDLMDSIKVALHNQSPAVTGVKVVLCFLEDSRSTLDPDGRTRHGVQRFRLITEGA